MPFRLSSNGKFSKTESFLKSIAKVDLGEILRANGDLGVKALAAATPIETGLAAHSWTFEIEESSTACSIVWMNTDVENGFPVAIALQYGYATGTGGYVQGRDYINPAMKPVFDQIENNVWKAVASHR